MKNKNKEIYNNAFLGLKMLILATTSILDKPQNECLCLA